MAVPGENVQAWSTTASLNSSADILSNWAEGMPRADVNNSARSMMAAHAKDRNLKNGSIVTAGTADAQTFTSGVGYTIVPTGIRVLLKIGPGLTNTGAVTLDMDSIGAVAVKNRLGDDIIASEFKENSYVEVIYDGTNWVVWNSPPIAVTNVIIQPPTVVVPASPVAVVDFTDLTNDFNQYVVVISGLVAASEGDALCLLVSTDNGATFHNSDGDYKYARDVLFDGSSIWEGVQSAPTGAAVIQMTDTYIDSDLANPMGGEIKIFGPFAASTYNSVQYQLSAIDTLDYIDVWRGVGVYWGVDTAAINAIRLLMAIDQIASGTFTIYGVK